MKSGKQAFTLIELLVVVAIIGILAALILPAMKGSRERAKKMKVQADLKRITTAFENYWNEYGVWHLITAANRVMGGGGQSAGEGDASQNRSSDGIALDDYILSILMPRYNTVIYQNPDRVMFIEVGQDELNADGDFCDPWGNPYRFLLDLNDDGRVFLNNFTPIYARVIAWSLGPDGDQGNNPNDDPAKDNINSWD